MIANERPSPYNRQFNRQKGYTPYAQQPPRQPVQEKVLNSGQMQIERKTIVVVLKENKMGRFVRISEEAGGRRNSVIIPADGLVEFQKLLDDAAKVVNGSPSQSGLA